MSQAAALKQKLLNEISVAPKENVATEAKSESTAVVDIKYLTRALLKYNASDLHLKTGRPPIYRINGKLIPTKMPDLTDTQISQILASIIPGRSKNDLQENRHVDFSFLIEELGRFRCNIFYQKGTISAAIRMIPIAVPRLEDLGLPLVLKELCHRPRGLLLVTGSTGSGKSTTLAAMIQEINETSYHHILTIEDPIEFVFRDLKSAITQREIGTDAISLKDALYAGMRQDPDVIVVGEMRDLATIQGALMAAETGHLVISTLHTNDAKSSIDRILDAFPGEVRNQVRMQLASTLVGVVSQQLVSTLDGKSRVVACEVMIKSSTIESYILKNELEKIPEAIENSNSYYKMQSLNLALHKLVKNGVISKENALRASSHPQDLELRLDGVERDDGYQSAG